MRHTRPSYFQTHRPTQFGSSREMKRRVLSHCVVVVVMLCRRLLSGGDRTIDRIIDQSHNATHASTGCVDAAATVDDRSLAHEKDTRFAHRRHVESSPVFHSLKYEIADRALQHIMPARRAHAHESFVQKPGNGKRILATDLFLTVLQTSRELQQQYAARLAPSLLMNTADKRRRWSSV